MKNSIVLYYYTELSANTLYITTYTNIIYIRHIHIHLTSKPVFCLQKVWLKCPSEKKFNVHIKTLIYI